MHPTASPRLAWRFALAATGLALVAGPAAQAAEFRLTPVADTSIFSDGSAVPSSWDDIADGQGDLWVSVTAGGLVRRALVRFDLSVIPADQRVVAASLTLYESRARNEHVVSLHRLEASWGEGASNGGAAGVGDAAEPGDATWRWRDFGVSAWDERGGDFASQASASLSVGFPNSFYTWGPSPGLVADVQAWHTDPAQNFGWILIGDENASQNAKRFDSRHSGVASQRPQLWVQTTPVPEPASAALLVAGALALAGWLRRRPG